MEAKRQAALKEDATPEERAAWKVPVTRGKAGGRRGGGGGGGRRRRQRPNDRRWLRADVFDSKELTN